MIDYKVIGTGKPIILVHGSFVADPWNGFEQILARKYKVYLPILPGFAGTPTVPGRIHNTDLFAEALGEFVKHEGLIKVPMVAFSLGAVVAVKTAAAGKYKGELILVGMPVRLESPLMRKILDLPLPARHMLAENEITRGGLLWAILNDIIGKIDLRMADKYLKMLRETDIRAMVDVNPVEEIEKDLPWILSQVKNRKYFVYGQLDKLKIGAEKWLKQKFLVIHGAGHDVFADKPKETVKLIEKILSWRRIFLL